MGWKKWPYWLKGGIIGLIIVILGALLISLSPVRCIGLSQDGTGCKPPQGTNAFVYNINSILNNFDMVFLYFILLTIIISSVIGWLIGKIKNKNK